MEIPEQDKRLYQSHTLSNGLECLLISDDGCEKAAAAVSVAVGQLQDPSEFPGLAHLVEHAVFMGTREFPIENEYDSYLSHHGGHSNAYTDHELTCYYCDCRADALEGALQRFASCLSCPLLQASSLEREIQAVDSEHANNRQEDFWRLHQLSKTIMGRGTNHPYAAFGTGNAAVLLPQVGDEQTKKEERILTLRDQVSSFYERYYKATNMRLVILGGESIDGLLRMAEAYFSKIPGVAPNDQSHNPAPIPALPLQPCAVKWVPVRESRTLDLQWVLPDQRSLYRFKPARYFSHLLGHEGPGSLLAVLRDKHWAQELSADDISRTTSAFSIFTVQVELTETGMDHYLEVIRMVYAYIAYLASIPEWVYEELSTIATMKFRFLSKPEPSQTCSDLAVNMQYYDPDHYYSGSHKIYGYDKALIEDCFQCLRPDNMYVFLASKAYTSEAVQVDPWYGTQYTIVSDELNQAIQEACLCSVKYPELVLPEPNDMIPTNFDLLKISNEAFLGDNVSPRCIQEVDSCRLWYKPDTVFGMPKVNALFLLQCPLFSSSPSNAVLGNLWSEVIHEICNDFSYIAFMAGINCDFQANANGMEITIAGYNHKASVLLQRICRAIREMPQKVNSEIFERIRDKLEQKFQAFLVSQPYTHAMNAADLCLEVSKWSVQSRLICLHRLETEDLIGFHKQFLSSFNIEALVHGNVSAQEAMQWTGMILDFFRPDPLLHRTALRVVSLQSDTLYRFPCYNKEDSNNCVMTLFQIGIVDIKTNATLGMLHQLLREPAFNQLRTEEQLGYLVHTGIKTNGERVKSFMFLIQSESFDPSYMDDRIEAFVAEFRSMIVAMSENNFATNVNSLRQTYLEKNKNLSEESLKHWQVITNRTYHFDRMIDLAREVQQVSKDDVLRFFDKYLLAGAPRRRKLAIHVYGRNHPYEMGNEGGTTAISDYAEFARCQPLYPVQESVSIESMKLDVSV